MNKADASTVDLIMAEGHFTIDLQNSHILTPCVDHCEPERMTLDEALPSPDEVDTLSHLDCESPRSKLLSASPGHAR